MHGYSERSRAWRLGLALVVLMAVAARAGADERRSAIYEGTLGAQRIGLVVDVDGGRIVGGRYCYLRYLKDIALTARPREGGVELAESGAVFSLRFVGNGSERGAPLDLDHSVGLEGSWRSGTAQWPVKLQLSGGASATPPGHWYGAITDEADEVFEARTIGFRAAVLAGDVDSAARYVHFPLRVNHGAGRHESIASTQALKKAWPRLFTPPYLAAIRDASPHAMSVVQGYAMLGNGLVFFSERGVDVLNVP